MIRAVVLLICPVGALASGWASPKIRTTAPYTPEHGRFVLAKDEKYQMPVTLGETLKLPQQIENLDVEILEASYRTDAASLLPFIPKQLELMAPIVTITSKQYKRIAWLSGRSYEQIAVTVPARYTAPDGTVTEGDFAPVVWSSSAEAIQAFRESVNLPYVYANISHEARTIKAKWDYTTFLTIDPADAAPDAAPPARRSSRSNLLSWGYIPSAVGKTPTASISQLTLLPSNGSYAPTSVPCSLAWHRPVLHHGEPAPGARIYF